MLFRSVEDVVEDLVEDKEHHVQKIYENAVTESKQSIIKKNKTSGTFIPTLQSSFHHTEGNSMDSYRNSNNYNDNDNDIIIHNKSINNSSSSSGENSYDNNYSSSSREDDVEVEVEVEVPTGSSVERYRNNEEESECVIHKVSTLI